MNRSYLMTPEPHEPTPPSNRPRVLRGLMRTIRSDDYRTPVTSTTSERAFNRTVTRPEHPECGFPEVGRKPMHTRIETDGEVWAAAMYAIRELMIEPAVV